jgi:lipopolysaccharide/colanic/teichoic acid biosynthesis glycosyltransferase
MGSFENQFMSGMARPTSEILFEASHSQSLSPSHWSNSLTKRVLDFSAALLMLAVLLLPMLLLVLLSWFTSPGDVFFTQERCGKGGKTFWIYKFRTMVSDQKQGAVTLTRKGDDRVTEIGRFLRRFKIDELPQLFNVLRGDMSLVGSRPKLAKYAEMDQMSCRPGITGAATLAFRGEEDILKGFTNPREMEDFYLQYIMPIKSQLDASYMHVATFESDLRIAVLTLKACAGVKSKSALLSSLKLAQAERLMANSVPHEKPEPPMIRNYPPYPITGQERPRHVAQPS